MVERSARQGWGEAQNNLAQAYEEGMENLPRDYQQAYAWYSVAYVNGNEQAKVKKMEIAGKLSKRELDEARLISQKYIELYSNGYNGARLFADQCCE